MRDVHLEGPSSVADDDPRAMMCSGKYERAIPAGRVQGGSLGGVAKECFLFRVVAPFSHPLFYSTLCV